MSEIPLEGPEISLDQVEALGALEKAFEEALSQVPQPYVLSQLMAMFPKVMSPRVIVEVDADALGRFHGRVQKVSVSMPEDLATAIRERIGPGGFSRYVTEAVERRFRHDRLGDLLDELDTEFGPVSPRNTAMGGAAMARQRRVADGALVLDAQGLVKLAAGDPAVRALVQTAHRRYDNVVTAASTLAEVLRGGAADARMHRILQRVTVASIDKAAGRKAGELLGATGLSGHRCAVDAHARGGGPRAATSGSAAHQRSGRHGTPHRGTGSE